MNDTASMLSLFAEASKEFSNGAVLLGPPPEFTQTINKIPGVRSEFCITDPKLMFHFWPDPSFPDDFGAKISAALRGFPQQGVVVEYVPEVNSWYTHLADLPLGASSDLAERVIKKISAEVVGG